MKILHICNDYSYSKVYENLYRELDYLGIAQVIFHPLRTKKNIGKNVFKIQDKNSELIYSSFLLKKYHRILFRLKTHSLYKDLINNVDVSKIDVCYPTTLFSDGAIAYRLFKSHNIPYVVAVRNTDVNLFLKYRPDLIFLMHKILQNAKHIIFISEGLKVKFYEHPNLIKKAEEYKRKTLVIANGIDDVWLKNIHSQDNSLQPKRAFLFVGRFDSNKNVENVILSLAELRNEYPDISLNLVGGGGNKDIEIKNHVIKNSHWINYLGYIYDKEKLIQIYRKNHFFVMPSIHETFGLVYIEALSQGLPILYTKNQGIDGVFGEEVGVGTLTDKHSVKEAIRTMLEKKDFKLQSIDFSNYNWSKIASRYIEVFKKSVY